MSRGAVFHPPREWAARPAVLSSGEAHSYGELDARSRRMARQLLAQAATPDLGGARVGFLMAPGAEYVVTQWAVWRAGGIAVPLCPDHPERELAYAIDDADCSALVGAGATGRCLEGLARERGIPFRDATAAPDSGPLPEIDPDRPAMILYTSGTTGRPKGVVTTHAQIEAHIQSLLEAWRWTRDDRILHVLPLHHTHGIVNALLCALRAAARVEFGGRFDPARVWDRLASGEVTLFMGVPTMYAKLLAAWDDATPATRARWSEGVRRTEGADRSGGASQPGLRLMVSGSAALPVRLFNRWEAATGHRILERYGMTEIGMGLSNPYCGERRPGTVGQPLPGVEVRLVDGEIQVRGPTVFQEYWRRPEETRAAFTDDGWFRTGDEGVLEDGYHRIAGRRSVDILKSGGYKISAVEIEEALREHPGVADCAVVGLPDEAWGERVAAAVVPAVRASRPGAPADGVAPLPEALAAWAGERLARYKVPRAWLRVAELPRNSMGKVRKPAVRDLFTAEAPAAEQPAAEPPAADHPHPRRNPA